MNLLTIAIILSIVLAFVFTFLNGMNDAANSISTIIATKVMTPVQAILWASFWEFTAFIILEPVIKPMSPALQADSLLSEPPHVKYSHDVLNME